jgi:hypothetical protein
LRRSDSSASPTLSFTIKQASVSSADHGGGKRPGINKHLHRVPEPPTKRQEATARSANRRLPVEFKALITRLTAGGHAHQKAFWSSGRQTGS